MNCASSIHSTEPVAATVLADVSLFDGVVETVAYCDLCVAGVQEVSRMFNAVVTNIRPVPIIDN